MKLIANAVMLVSLFVAQFSVPYGAPAPEEQATDIPTETSTATSTPDSSTETVTPPATETAVPPSETSTPPESATPTNTETPTPTSTVTATATVPAVSLVLSTSSGFVTAGETITIQWEVAGVTVDPSLNLQITLPAGLTPNEHGRADFDERTRVLSVQVTEPSGEFELQMGRPTEDLVISGALLKGEEVLAIAQVLLPLQEKFDLTAAGGKINAANGRITIDFSPETLPGDTTITVGPPAGAAIPLYSLSDQPFEIRAQGRHDGIELHEFAHPIEIKVDYSDLNILESWEEHLFLHWYNPETQEWEALQTSVNQETNTLRGFTSHFSVFDIGIDDWDSGRTPTIDSFQVSTFTGAATYALPIQVPAGPGGLQPNLTLSYNSQVVDQATATSQGSWVGMGWSLETGSVVLDSGATSSTADDTYLLSVGGMSARLAWDGTAFRSADENFWRFQKNAGSDTWTAWDKTGNIYYFEARTQLTYSVECNKDEQVGGPEYLTYLWSLSRVRNIFGQELTYTYAEETKVVPMESYSGYLNKCMNASPTTETAVFPATIVYPGARYRIRFETESRTDYIASWATDNGHHTFERSRLKNIHIEQDSDGNGSFETTIRRYAFSYAPNTDTTNIVHPYYTYSAGGKTITLRSVQEYGVGGTTSLPATTFTYGDNMHLTAADNGYGGRVEFTYDMWYYESAPIRHHNIFYDFCSIGSWIPRNGGSSASISSCRLLANGSVINPSLTYSGGLPLLRPGGKYRLTANIYSLGAGVSVQIGAYDGATDTLSAAITTTGTHSFLLTLPSNAGSAQPLIVTTGGQATLDDFRVELLPTYYRVTQRRLIDGQGHQYDFGYTYQNPAVNDQAHSSTCAPNTPTCDSIVETLTEFRGHDLVVETGPDGHKTEYSFFQNDSQRGQQSQIVVKTSGNTKLTETILNWTVSTLSLPVPSGIEYMGFGHYWVRSSSTEQRVYDSNGTTYTKTLTVPTYESTYGNLTAQADQFWTGSAWSTYRSTSIDYFPYTSSTLYLVGLPARQQLKNSAASVVAETLNIYDSNSTYNTAPSAGKLSAVRTWTSGTSYSQVTYAYDSYGNPTTVTTYSGYGTASAAPSTGARTSYTCFGSGGTLGGTTCTDDGYHTYALWTKNSLGQITNLTYDYTLGVPLTESDPNDVGGNDTTIAAEYDLFGRITKIIRPGDSSGSPTLGIAYADSSSGLQVTLTQKIDATQTYTLIRKYDGMGWQFQTNGDGVLTDYVYDGYGRVVSQSTAHISSETAYHTITTYDGLGRPLTITAPDSATSSFTYNGLTVNATDARSNTTTTVADVWGRTVSVTPPTGPGVTYTYDEANQLKTATRATLTTTLTYDNAGRKLNMTDPDMGYWQYSYDALGNLTSQTDARSCVLTLTYDSLNRLDTKSSSGAGCGTQISIDNSFDSGTNGVGRRTSMTDNSGSTTWTYDTRGRVIGEVKVISGNSYTTGWTYTSADLPETMTYPGGEVVTYGYNARMLVNSLSGTSTYVQSTTYDSASRIDIRVFGSGTQTDYDYFVWNQQGGRVQFIKSGTSSTPTSLQYLEYDYDAVGNLDWIKDWKAGAPQQQTFAYDALDRLTSAYVFGGDAPSQYSETYTYDATTGNLSSRNSTTLIAGVYAGGYYTCTVSTGGGAKCWGNNGNGQLGDNTTTQRTTPVDVSGMTSGVSSIAGGGWHTCALTTSGGVKCWGYNGDGQLGDGTTTQRTTPVDVSGLTSGVTAITAGYYHTCALTTAGGVKCWGYNGQGGVGDGTTTSRSTPVDVSGLTSGVIAIDAGAYHTCAVLTGGGVKCWGRNADGQIGDGSTTNRTTPVDVSGLSSGVSAIGAGGYHTCALLTTGGLKCWGRNSDGQVGDGTTTQRNTPVDVSGLTSGVAAIAPASYYTCALTTAGGVKCWGYNGQGGVGDGTTTSRSTPVDVSGLTSGVTLLSSGAYHACATASGVLKCWGSSGNGQIGNGTTTNRTTAVDVSGMTSGVSAITAGRYQSCAISTSGGLKCWGNNSDGQVGDNSTTDRTTPVQVSGLTSGVTATTSGYYHTCALTSSGGVKCWGKNTDGQLGDGTNTGRTIPVDVSGLSSGVAGITADGWHTCAVTTAGGAKCWGANADGQLGDGTTTSRNSPVDVSGLTSGVAQITAGRHHTCALLTGGGVKCWGYNGDGQLGDGTNTNRMTPVDVSGLTSGVSAIAAGDYHTCALLTSGGVKCWGYNGQGGLGDGTTTSRNMPTQVSGLTSGVAVITTGAFHSCAVTTGGGAKCWGNNSDGQLGDGTITPRTDPGDVSGLTSGVSTIAAAGWHTCAVTTAGGAKCWGLNGDGQLGNGQLSYYTLTVQALWSGTITANSYTYDATHRHAVASLSNGNTYSYDANGNMTQRVIGGQTFTLGYDADGRLVTVSGPSLTVSFAYDGDGKRVKSTINGTSTYFVGNYYEASGGTVTKYYYAGSQRVAMRSGSTLYYLIGDHLGSTALTTDSAGVLVSEIRYKAWGEARYANGTTVTNYRYTGQQEESSFGLYYYDARWYDPALSRFAQADTIIPGTVNAQSWDRYAYTLNNPLRYIDPSGHKVTCEKDEDCEQSQMLSRLTGARYWKKLIEIDFGITMSDAKHKWDAQNLEIVYLGLSNIDRVLYGRTKSLVGGSTFYLDGSAYGTYGGVTSGNTILFRTGSTIPFMNFYHEFAHLLDNAMQDTFTTQLGKSAQSGEDGTYWFGGDGVGVINTNLLRSTGVYDPYWSEQFDGRLVAAIQHQDSGPIEQWADIFSNYVAGNIDLSQAGGQAMNNTVQGYLTGAGIIP